MPSKQPPRKKSPSTAKSAPARKPAQRAASKKAVAAKPASKASSSKASGSKASKSRKAATPAPRVAAKASKPAKPAKPKVAARASKLPGPDEADAARLLQELRKIVKALPGTTEVEAWGHPTFRVKDKIFATFGMSDGQPSMGVKATHDMQAALVSSDPRFSIADYVGKHGWVTMDLSGTVDLGEVDALVRESYRLIAPTALVAALGQAKR